MTKKELMDINITELSDKARRFFEESDPIGITNIFGGCKDLADIEQTAEELYDEFFGEEA